MNEQPHGNRPPDECAGPWYTASGNMRPVGDEGWLCEVHGADFCPESSQWGAEDDLVVIAMVPPRILNAD